MLNNFYETDFVSLKYCRYSTFFIRLTPVPHRGTTPLHAWRGDGGDAMFADRICQADVTMLN